MKFSAERLTPELEHEISELVDKYYDVTNASVRLPPYDFVWEAYEAIDKIDKLLIVTARDDDQRLLGLAMYIIDHALHHRGMLLAECDTLAVDHTVRGKGIGKTLYLVAETILIEAGVNRVIHNYRTVYTEPPLFPKLGFTCEQHVYMKDL